MPLGNAIGTVWLSRKDEKLSGLKLLLFHHVEVDYRLRKSYEVATDTVDAGVVIMVYYITTDEAVIFLKKKPSLYDVFIVDIVDRIDLKE